MYVENTAECLTLTPEFGGAQVAVRLQVWTQNTPQVQEQRISTILSRWLGQKEFVLAQVDAVELVEQFVRSESTGAGCSALAARDARLPATGRGLPAEQARELWLLEDG